MSIKVAQDGLLQKNKDPTLNETDLPDPPAFLHDQFLFFGDSITQSDGDPALGFSCYQALQHGTVMQALSVSTLTT